MKEVKIYFQAQARFTDLVPQYTVIRTNSKLSDVLVYGGKKTTLYLKNSYRPTGFIPAWEFSYKNLKQIADETPYVVSHIESVNINSNTNRLNLTLHELDIDNKWETTVEANITTIGFPLTGIKKLSVPRNIVKEFGDILDIRLANQYYLHNDSILLKGDELMEIEFKLAIVKIIIPSKAIIKHKTLSKDPNRNLDYLCEVIINKQIISEREEKTKNVQHLEEKAKPYLDLGLDKEFAIAIANGGDGKEIIKLWQSDWWQQYTTDDRLIQAVLSGLISNKQAQYLNGIRSDFDELVTACLDERITIPWAKALLKAGFAESPEGVSAVLNGGDPELVAMLLKLKVDSTILPPVSGVRL